MRVVAIVQARMGSTRLPGKVLAELGGRPMLAQQLRRLAGAASIDDVVVATSDRPEDEAIAALAGTEGARSVRGDPADVLSRYVLAASEARADVVVRVTADCPLIDPEVIDRVVAALAGELDYASNVVHRTFPHGLDVEAMHADTLTRLDRMARSDEAREHVTWLLRFERPELFATADVVDGVDNSDLRWTVDTPDDLAHVRRLYAELGLADRALPYGDVVAHERSARS